MTETKSLSVFRIKEVKLIDIYILKNMWIGNTLYPSMFLSAPVFLYFVEMF